MKKIISILLILAMAAPAFATEVLGVPQTTGQSWVNMLNDYDNCKEQLVEYEKGVENLTTRIGLEEKEIEGLRLDKVILGQSVDELKLSVGDLSASNDNLQKALVKANEDLIKSEESKSSRLTWASIGGALVLGVEVLIIGAAAYYGGR